MKRIIIILITAVLLTSCNDWLAEKPSSFIGPEQIEDSEGGVDVWVSGVYANYLDDMFRWAWFPFVLELDCDYISGPDWFLGTMGAGNFQAAEMVPGMWKCCYNLIMDANLAERQIAKMQNVSDAYKNNAIGELYFHEAFAYFLLVRAFGPVPCIKKDVLDGGSYSSPRDSVEVVYDHIIGLLEDAASMMYKSGDPRRSPGHVCAASAAGLLAKVYATMASAAMPEGTPITVRTGNGISAVYSDVEFGQTVYKYSPLMTNIFYKEAVAGYDNMDSAALYAKASEWAKKVIDGEYGTVELSDYDKLWKASNRDASEFLFSVQSLSGEMVFRTQVHVYYSGVFASATSNKVTTGQWLGNTYNWYRLFDDGDYRITNGVRHLWQQSFQADYNGYYYYPESDKDKYAGLADGNTYQYTHNSYTLAFTMKYDDVTDRTAENSDSAYPFLRYADVMLIYAEAQNELGHGDEAMLCLNKIRKRSNAVQMAAVPGRDAMRSAILEERAKELACEGDRRWDLIRWGIYIDAMNAVSIDDSGVNKKRTGKHLLFPIPQEEINSNTQINENNPGWN
ncbi:MAG: RagB/SusD family nutrient uptake outer membrane protein [Bacteroidales bacterium]|nr:RagB/SusD family nutrient uptake outer membrane protein [Bacteroidales bacterium]